METFWAMVLEVTGALEEHLSKVSARNPFLFIYGKMSPALRAADSTSAKGTCAVIEQSPWPP